MATKIERVYWDTCLFIAMIEEESDRHLCCSNLFREASEEGKTQIVTSCLTIAECPNLTQNEEQEKAIADFFTNKCVVVVDVQRWISQKSREIRRETNHWHTKTLNIQDSLHLATAVYANVDRVLTYDETDLIPLSKRFRTRDGRPLPISKPQWTGTPPMF
jgi:predicted nucleic acid-binding protein